MAEEEPWLILQRATNEKRWPWNNGRRMDQTYYDHVNMRWENVVDQVLAEGPSWRGNSQQSDYERLLADGEVE